MSNPTERLLSLLPSAKRNGRGWRAFCPAHDDESPSLSVNEGDDGRALIHCFAGCPPRAVLDAIGLSESDLFARDDYRAPKKVERELVATYSYVDETGDLLYQSLRYQSKTSQTKTFRQRRPDGHGGWIWNTDGVRKVLYNLPLVIQAVAEERIVAVVEGEKCADALTALGLVATTNVGGAGGWRAEYNTSLRNANVVVFPDNDKPGIRHARQVALFLSGIATSVKTVSLPDLPKKGDVADWLADGGTTDDLYALIAAAQDFSPDVEGDELRWEHADDGAPDSRSSSVVVTGGKKLQSQLVIELAQESGDQFWHTPSGDPYVTVTEQRRRHLRVRSREYQESLARRFYFEHHKPAGRQNIANALAVLASVAVSDSPEHTAHLRVAEVQDGIYLDLADAAGSAVRISPDGWDVAAPPADLRFLRPPSMSPLPRPAHGGSLDRLRDFVNVADEDAFRLLAVWILAALRETGPFPLLVLQGEQGSAKSTFARLLFQLIDPCRSPLRVLPRDARDFFIHASNAHLLGFDNVSRLPDALSDVLCQIATGGGYATRTLYTDGEESVFDAQRPIILNGIEKFITRADLNDRCLVIECPSIPEHNRRAERELWQQFDLLRPAILGGLLDALSAAMRMLPSVHLDSAPRMADFAKWGSAVETALAWPEGQFRRTFDNNRLSTITDVIEYDSVGNAICRLAPSTWGGTMGELHKTLNESVPEHLRDRHDWPASPRALSNRLRRLRPDLRRLGVLVEFEGRSNRGSLIRITTTTSRTEPGAGR